MARENNRKRLPEEAAELLEKLGGAAGEAYLVGASARAIVAGSRLPGLLEIALKVPSEDLGKLGATAGLENVRQNANRTEGLLGSRPVHLIPFRSEKERHSWDANPSPEVGDSIEEHLSSYHLKLEGIAVDSEGRVTDQAGARADIGRRVVSAIEDPEKAFAEYPAIMLRVAALMAELGFSPAPNVLSAAIHHSHSITTVRPDFWREELEKTLLGDFPGNGLDFLVDTRLCNFVLPEITNLIGFEATSEYHHKDLWEHTKLAVGKGKKAPAIRWALLLHDLGKVYTRTVEDGEVRFHKHEQVSRLLAMGMLYRRRFSRDLRSRILFLISNHMKPGQYEEEWTDSAVRRFMRSSGDMLEDLIEISRADISSKNQRKVRRNLQSLGALGERVKQIEYEESTRIRLPKGLGNMIMEEFGLEPSSEVGELIAEVKTAIEEGTLKRDRPAEEYLKYLTELKESEPRPD